MIRFSPFCSNENMRFSYILITLSECNKSRWSLHISRILQNSLYQDSLYRSLGVLLVIIHVIIVLLLTCELDVIFYQILNLHKTFKFG